MAINEYFTTLGLKAAYKKKRKKVIKFLAHMCHCAQTHVSDEEAWGPLKDQEDRLQCTSFVVSCFISQTAPAGRDGVEWEVVIDRLCKKVYTVKKWKRILKKEFKQYE